VAGLEGRVVSGEGRNWIARVHGVHGDGRWWWIQIAPADDASASIVVRCSRHAKAEHILTALKLWHPQTAFSLLVTSVMA
jgi:hypothetical protein